MQTKEIKIGDLVRAINTLYCPDGLWAPKAGKVYTVQDLDEGLGNVWLSLQEDTDANKRSNSCNWGVEAFDLVIKQTTKSTESTDSAACTQTLQNEAGGVKCDQGKLRYTLLLQDLPRAVKEVVEVLEFGAKKYKRMNFEKIESHRYDEAFLRHAMKYLQGEINDPESGKQHLSHLVCCAMFLIERHLKEQEDK